MSAPKRPLEHRIASRTGTEKEGQMKLKNLVFGLVAVAALVAAIPALAATHHAAGSPSHAASAKSQRGTHTPRAHHAHRGARASADKVDLTAPFVAEFPDTAAQALFARTGSMSLPISFGSAGTVTATAESPVGTATETAYGTAPDGHTEAIQVPRDSTPAIESTSVTATAAGTSEISLQLTPWAKSQIAAGKDLTVYLSLEPAQGANESIPGQALILTLPGS
jgi:hypothetical protein